MRASTRVSCHVAVVVAILWSAAPRAMAQDLGHRLIGTQGLRAGRQRDPGLYVADQLGYYAAEVLRDRHGATVPIEDLRLSALANALGVSAVLEIPELSTYVSFGAAVPLATVSMSSARPDVSVDRLGLGDVFLQPLQLGWRLPHVDLLAGYALYLPTGLFRLGEGSLSRGHRTHELSLGMNVSTDDETPFFVSALASYDLNETKSGIDLRRGDTVQIQGGIGATLFRLLDIGAVGAALWQVTDDRGADLPPALQGARDHVFGLGAEVGVMLPMIRGRIGARYVHELDARSRPEGQILVFSLAMAAWQPDADAPPPIEAPDEPVSAE